MNAFLFVRAVYFCRVAAMRMSAYPQIPGVVLLVLVVVEVLSLSISPSVVVEVMVDVVVLSVLVSVGIVVGSWHCIPWPFDAPLLAWWEARGHLVQRGILHTFDIPCR